MPRKTRKEKIIADYRKKIKLLQNQEVIQHQPNKNLIEEASIEAKKTEELKASIHDNTAPKINLSYFKSDLRKSLILTIAIITLEILFYFATIKNYLKLN